MVLLNQPQLVRPPGCFKIDITTPILFIYMDEVAHVPSCMG